MKNDLRRLTRPSSSCPRPASLCVALALVKPTYLCFCRGRAARCGHRGRAEHPLVPAQAGASAARRFDASSAAQEVFAAMSVPVVILTGGSVAWLTMRSVTM
ncbi:MAG: hypothetical protein ACLSWY_10355 [Ruthenibacterium lactatiformans]